MTQHFTIDDAQKAARTLSVDTALIPLESLREGMDEELEHGSAGDKYGINITNDDPLISAKIALAHLHERPDYYARLSRAMDDDARTSKMDIFFMIMRVVIVILVAIILFWAALSLMPVMVHARLAAMV